MVDINKMSLKEKTATEKIARNLQPTVRKFLIKQRQSKQEKTYDHISINKLVNQYLEKKNPNDAITLIQYLKNHSFKEDSVLNDLGHLFVLFLYKSDQREVDFPDEVRKVAEELAIARVNSEKDKLNKDIDGLNLLVNYGHVTGYPIKIQKAAMKALGKSDNEIEQALFLINLEKDVEDDKHIPPTVKLNDTYEHYDGKTIRTSNECIYVPIYAAKLAGYLTEDEFTKCGLKGHITGKKGIFFGKLQEELIKLKNKDDSPQPTDVGIRLSVGLDKTDINHFIVVKNSGDTLSVNAIEREPRSRSHGTSPKSIPHIYVSLKEFSEVIKKHISK